MSRDAETYFSFESGKWRILPLVTLLAKGEGSVLTPRAAVLLPPQDALISDFLLSPFL